jgi:hypothetical protein
MNPETIITLQVQDNETETVKTTFKVAQQSKLLKGLFEEMNEQVMNLDAIPIYAEDLTMDNLIRAVAFMVRRSAAPMKEIQQPLFVSLSECVDEADFLTVSDLGFHDLGKLLTLATYLNIPDLVELIGARLAEMIRDITPEQLAEKLGVDYRSVISQEEEDAVRQKVEESLAQYN